MKEPSSELLKALAVTAELTGTVFTESAIKVLAADLVQFDEHQVMSALRRCRRELTGHLTVAAILSRIDDGRPTPEIAWSQICALTERDTIVGPTEQIEAFAAVSNMIDAGETIPARMAFLERYKSLVARAKDEGGSAQFRVSPGYDPHQRDSVVRQALETGLLTDQQALPHIRGLLPNTQKLLDDLGKGKLPVKVIGR